MIFGILFIAYTFDFNDNNEYQTKELDPGNYIFECWGAQGRGSIHWTGMESFEQKSKGGKGAYTKGIISITTKTTFYIYVGGESKGSGLYPSNFGYTPVVKGGSNGGGDSGHDLGALGDADGHYESGGGGGATDIRINNNKIASRIMVAAGGSGGVGSSDGAPGGNKAGMYMTSNKLYSTSKLTTNTSGGSNGQGQKGCDNDYIAGSGGGGGYYGGVAAEINEKTKYAENEHYKLVAHSGSSFIKEDLFLNPSYKVGEREGDGKVVITQITCPTDCNLCDENKKCYSCKNSKYLYQSKCIASCQKGTYPSGSSTIGRECLPCNSSCYTCSNNQKCNLCKEPMYVVAGICYSNCSDANTDKVHYGIIHTIDTKQCRSCQVDKCIDCWSNYTECDRCIDSYIFDENTNKCVIKPTDAFSNSNYFSRSMPFSDSNGFSKTMFFSDSNDFSRSMPFSESNDFTNSINENIEESSIQSNEESSSESNEESSSESNEESSSESNEESSSESNEESSSESNEESSSDDTVHSSDKSNDEWSSESNAESSHINIDETASLDSTESDGQNNDKPSNNAYEYSTSNDNWESTSNTKEMLPIENNEETMSETHNSFLFPSYLPKSYTQFDPAVNNFDSVGSEKEISSPWWILLIVAAIVVVLVIVIVILWRMKKNEETNEVSTQEIDDDDAGQSYQCKDVNDLSNENPLYKEDKEIDPFENDFEEI